MRPPRRPRRRRILSPLTRRILFLNLIGPALLGIGFLYLDDYRSGLIDAQLAALRMQARIVATAVSETARPDDDARWVLNVLPAADGASSGYALNGAIYAADADGAAQLAEALAQGYRANPRLEVNLRADRATRYRFVEPAMRAATTAARLAGGGALPRLNLVVEELRGDLRGGKGALPDGA